MAGIGHPLGIPEAIRTEILGAPVDCVLPEDLPRVLDRLAETASESDGPGGQLVFIRTSDVLRARRDKSYRRILWQSGLVLPVSRDIARGLAALRRPLPARYYPQETMIRILGWLESRKGGLYLLGGSGREIMTVEQRLRQTFPGCRIVGRYMGDFPKGTEGKICMAVRKSNPMLLVGGPGLLGEDKWIGRRTSVLNRGVQVWQGDFFGYILGRSRRVNKVSFRKGREYLEDLKKAPWKLLTLGSVLWFRFLVLLERAFAPRPLRRNPETEIGEHT